MLMIECPWCGARAESEFSYGGEADIARPANTGQLSDREWADYLFMRKNTRGVHREQWLHAHGCRRWFKVSRNTVTYEIQGYETFAVAHEVLAHTPVVASAFDRLPTLAASADTNQAECDTAGKASLPPGVLP